MSSRMAPPPRGGGGGLPDELMRVKMLSIDAIGDVLVAWADLTDALFGVFL